MLKKLLIIVLAFVLAVVAWLFLTRSYAVVYRFKEKAAVQYSGFVILNPFRDKGPEIEAEVVLRSLESGKCKEALFLPEMTSDRAEYLCEREIISQIRSWSLMDRRDDGNRVELLYLPQRKYLRDTMPKEGELLPGPPITIQTQRSKDGWQAVSYDTYY